MSSSRHSAIKECMICCQPVSVLFILDHIPKCYYKECKANLKDPLCTCDDCKGERIHRETVLGARLASEALGNSLPPSKIQYSQNYSPTSSSASSPTSSVSPTKNYPGSSFSVTYGSPVAEKPENQFPFSMDECSGNVCFLCGVKMKNKSPFPAIHIGKHVYIVICKKTHINVLVERNQLIQKLTDCVAAVKSSGDKPIVLVDLLLSDDEDEPEEPRPPANQEESSSSTSQPTNNASTSTSTSNRKSRKKSSKGKEPAEEEHEEEKKPEEKKDIKPAVVSKTVQCSGKHGTPSTTAKGKKEVFEPCKKQVPFRSLYIKDEEEDEILDFCKPAHLINYIIHVQIKKGKKKAEKKKN